MSDRAIGRVKCQECDNPRCSGKQEELREYQGYGTQDSSAKHVFVSAWTELTSHCSEEQIVRWVNELAVRKERERFYHQKAAARRQAIVKAAERLLDADELAEINRQAIRKVEER